MNKELEFDDDHKEVLRELMNVAYGSATAIIAEILDAFATLHIPKIELFHDDELRDYIIGKMEDDAFLCSQGINGKISGESIFILNRSSMKNISKYFDFDDSATDEDLNDIATELTNIVSSTTVGKLAEQVNSMVAFSPPHVNVVNKVSIKDDLKMKDYSQAIVVSTSIEFEEEHIYGDLILFIQDESIVWIKKKLDVIIEEYL